MLIFPSPFTEDKETLETICKKLDPYVPGYHIDIMDGIFVHQKMGSIKLSNHINTLTPHPLWVHLMVSNPLNYVQELQLKSNSIVSFHIETGTPSEQLTCIELLKHNNLQPSLALSPTTPVSTLFSLCHKVKHILVMSVTPGKSGQIFLPITLERLKKLLAYKATQELNFDLAIDGGVTDKLIPTLKEHAITMAAVTSALFSSNDLITTYQKLTKI